VKDDSVDTVKRPRLLVIDIKTREPVHAVKLAGKNERYVNTVRRGLERNMGSRYYVKEDL
jgi:hypothetical protein